MASLHANAVGTCLVACSDGRWYLFALEVSLLCLIQYYISWLVVTSECVEPCHVPITCHGVTSWNSFRVTSGFMFSCVCGPHCRCCGMPARTYGEPAPQSLSHPELGMSSTSEFDSFQGRAIRRVLWRLLLDLHGFERAHWACWIYHQSARLKHLAFFCSSWVPNTSPSGAGSY